MSPKRKIGWYFGTSTLALSALRQWKFGVCHGPNPFFPRTPHPHSEAREGGAELSCMLCWLKGAWDATLQHDDYRAAAAGTRAANSNWRWLIPQDVACSYPFNGLVPCHTEWTACSSDGGGLEFGETQERKTYHLSITGGFRWSLSRLCGAASPIQHWSQALSSVTQTTLGGKCIDWYGELMSGITIRIFNVGGRSTARIHQSSGKEHMALLPISTKAGPGFLHFVTYL